MIRFLLDTHLIEIEDLPPDLTVLDWLRLHQQRTGTKEGCGSGDCGACTVVVATPASADSTAGYLKYETINSCITFLGALHGKQLLTVESLAVADKLHPVQQAMVDAHGSQCGFCTPGFIMSMFALYQQRESVDQLTPRIDQALGGNLCRCTGYRSIKNAAVNSLAFRDTGSYINEHHPILNKEQEVLQQLLDLSQEPISSPCYHQPRSIAELVSILESESSARLVAGGTDLALEVTQQMQDLSTIVSLTQVEELRSIVTSHREIVVGAAVTISELMNILGDRVTGVRPFLLRFGSDQIRNQGTIGGNIGSASPIGDLLPLLIALGASLIIQKGQVTREIALESHFIDYKKTTLQVSEFIHSVRIPLPQVDDYIAVYKVSKRHDDDISSVCLASFLSFSNDRVNTARLAYGGMAGIPKRALRVESALVGKTFNISAIEEAQDWLEKDFQPISDARASANYRMQVARNLLQRLQLEYIER